jgi:predicted polyphosphate/ATP-dependent NAD kinase
MSTVGVIVNPVAGKDIRRLVTSASHTSDSVKIGIVRRTVIAAFEAGAQRVLVADDPHRLGRRAVDGLDGRVHTLDEPVTGSRHDTVAAATRMWKEHVGAVVALGGDGTCRDVAIGWPDVPLIAVSTGTNNVYPSAIDATSAGAAAGFVASGAVDVATVTRRSKRVSVHIDDDGIEGGLTDDLALVDLALIDTTFVGSRAVLDPSTVRVVIASMASPSGTGLSSIAGRAHPVGRFEDGGVAVRLGAGGRRVRVPLAPGSFTTVEIAEITPLPFGRTVRVHGPGVLAFDGERDRRISRDAQVSVSIEPTGPLLIDVDRTLAAAAADRLFDVPLDTHGGPSWPPSS